MYSWNLGGDLPESEQPPDSTRVPGGGVALFVRMLGSCWANRVVIGQDADTARGPGADGADSELRAWLADVGSAPPHIAGQLVVAAARERAIVATRLLLSEARTASWCAAKPWVRV